MREPTFAGEEEGVFYRRGWRGRMAAAEERTTRTRTWTRTRAPTWRNQYAQITRPRPTPIRKLQVRSVISSLIRLVLLLGPPLDSPCLNAKTRRVYTRNVVFTYTQAAVQQNIILEQHASSAWHTCGRLTAWPSHRDVGLRYSDPQNTIYAYSGE